MQQSFDAAGNRTQLKALRGGSGDFVNDCFYDNLHGMTRVEPSGTAGAGVAEKRIDYSYDTAGR